MKIAISADCFSSYTSGFPVRGMMLALIKIRPQDQFVLFYSQRLLPDSLNSFYKELHDLPNVRKELIKSKPFFVTFKGLFTFSSIKLDDTYNVFINPGHPEYIRGFKGVQINSIADLSTVRGYSTIRFSKFWKYQSIWSKTFIFNRINTIVCISKYTENDVHALFPNSKDKTKVIYNGIDDFWFDTKLVSNEIVKRFEQKKYFIWWGNVSKRKNIENLFLAYKKALLLNSKLPNLLMVGGFQSDQLFLKKELGEKIISIPFQDNYTMKTLVHNSKGLIFPSYYEGFGLPIIEAFSQEIPVACSNVTSLPEVSNGLSVMFLPTDIEGISKGILRLFDLKPQNKELISQSKKFTYNESARLYSMLIDSKV